MLAVQAFLLPSPTQAAGDAGTIYLAHLESPHRHEDREPLAAPGQTGHVATRRSEQTGEATPAIKPPTTEPSRSPDSFFSGLLPHGACLFWRPGLLWTHVISDALTALAYFSIPVALLVFVRRREDLRFGWMFVLFGLFILACGAGHLTTIYNLWVPDYLTSGLVKGFTAAVSLVTAVILWPLIPKALALPGPAQLEAVNSDLRKEIAERREAEEQVRQLNGELERRVRERTAELETANLRLAEANRQLHQKEAALQKNQCLLRSIIDNSTTVIYVKDLEGRYLLINRRFEELFHINQEEIAGRIDHEIFPKEQADAFRAVDQEVIAAGTVLEAEEVAPHDDGLHTYLSFKAPLFDAAGRPYAVCGISADITGRKRDEEVIRRLNGELQGKIEELVAAQEELVRKEKLATLGRLSGSVGHELRNPLGVMSNAVYFLKMVLTEADETVKEYLDIIDREVLTSQRFIGDLLDFARTKPPQTREVRVRDLIEDSLGKCAIPENVELRTALPGDLPALRLDTLQMQQVLQNLVTNGCQAMPQGGALCISARSERNSLAIDIADTGEGISPDNMRKLFQPLFTTKPKGIGLGLVVCKNLVEANGGRIEVASEWGQGTTFTVTIPVAGRNS